MSSSSSPSPPSATANACAAERDRLAIEAAGLGVWEMDLTTGQTTWNPRMFALHGLDSGARPPSFDAWLEHVHPDDQHRVANIYQRLLTDPSPLSAEFRLLRTDGEVRHVKSVTRSVTGPDGSIQRLVGTIEDITDQVNHRLLSQAKSRELETFFDISLSLMAIATLEGRLLVLNGAWERVLGHSRSELLGTNILALVHVDDIAATEEALSKLTQGQDIVDFIHRLRCRDGSYRHIEWRSTSKDGQIYASANDVSSRMALERQVVDERNFLQLIIDSLPNPVFAKDWHGRHTLANDCVAELFGTTKQAMMGKTDHAMPPDPEEIAAFLRDDREVMSSGKPKFIREERLTDANGKRHWFQTVKVPLMLDNPPERRQVVGIATDITERKQAEQRLAEQERLYRSLVESQYDLIVRVDRHNRFVYVNDAYCRTFGKTRSELLGQTFTPLVHEEDLPATLAAIETLYHPPHRAYMEQRAMTREGWRWLAWEDSAILGEDGSVVEIQGVGRDITALKEAQRRAEAASRHKSEFLANMSHEIRTPINAVIGFTDLLSRTPLTAEQSDYLGSLQHSARLLLRLIDDILDVSRLEAGQLTLETQRFTLDSLIAQQRALFARAARSKGLSLQLHVDDALPTALVGDPLRLGQVLTNLLGNAIKFTERGEVTLEIARAEQEQEREREQPATECCRLDFAVRDTGIGIDAKHLEHLFSAFRQADSSTTRRFGGSGLGLTISQRLVEAMGGTLTVSSRPGSGSCFRFQLTLPVGDADGSDAAAPAATRVATSVAGSHILVAEDNPINRKLTARLLDELEVDYQIVEDGQQALDAASGGAFDLVLMDLQMPVLDGFTAARQLTRRRPELPVIALSAAVLEEERQRALDAGMLDHLAKPIDQSRLADCLARWLPVRKAAASLDDTASCADEAGDAAPADGEESIDMTQGLASAGGDMALYREVLALFLTMLDDRYRALPEQIARGEAVADTLHTLKGSASSLGASALAASAQALEGRLKAGDAAAPEEIAAFETALADTRQAVKQIINAA